jgi:hypothetical protein
MKWTEDHELTPQKLLLQDIYHILGFCMSCNYHALYSTPQNRSIPPQALPVFILAVQDALFIESWIFVVTQIQLYHRSMLEVRLSICAFSFGILVKLLQYALGFILDSQL